MRILCDANVSRRTTADLVAAGHDAIHSTERLEGSALDQEVVAVARGEDRTIVSFDGDIPTLVALSGESGPSVIHLRMRSALPGFVSRVLIDVLTNFGEQLARGTIVVVEDDRVRVRELPLGREVGP